MANRGTRIDEQVPGTVTSSNNAGQIAETKECSACHLEKPVEEFHKRTRAKDGLQSVCKACNCEQRKAYYKTAHGRAVDFANGKRGQYRTRVLILKYLQEHPCVDCGEADPVVLEFDHVDPGGKEWTISLMVRNGCGWARILSEIEKCDVRCANCHKRRTAIQFGWYKAD